MQKLVPVVVALALMGCPPKKPVIPPEPSGRCEVDLAALNQFGDIGNGVSARVVERPDELIGGNSAQGRVGDYLLENDRVRVLIQQPTRTISPLPYGGAIIDADLRRASGPGRDEFGKMGPIHAFGRTVKVSKVEVLNDGARGGYGVIAASGADEVIDYLNVNNVLTTLGNVQLVRDPELPIALTITTYFVLSPGESRVRMLTAYCNESKEPVSMQVGDLIDQGGVSDVFNPDSCTNGVGLKDCLADPMSWFGYQAEAVAYGYRAYKFTDSRAAATNVLISFAGAAAIMANFEDVGGLLTWLDPDVDKRPGSFGILPGDKRTFLRDLFIGRDLGEISSSFVAIDGTAKSRMTVTALKDDGSPAGSARVAVRVAETGRMAALLVADAQGVAKVDLKPGNYLVGTAVPGAAILPLTSVSLPSNGTAAISVRQGPTRTLTVHVADHLARPLTAKVMVRCTNPPCAQQAIDYRPWLDVEDQPSDLQAIVHVGAQGVAAIPLPPGQYEVLVTRGPEYSAFPDSYPVRGAPIDVRSADATLDVTLAQVVDTTGWMSADLHVHALNSPDSAVGNATRALSFAAEGVDVLVSTDHDFVTDYGPVLADLRLSSQMASMIGCEVTPFDFGHHNAFPVTRRDTITGGAFDWAGGDGASLRLSEIYAGVRAADPDAVIQMNHPRTRPGGALTMMKIDTATGATHADPADFRQLPNPDATPLDTKLFDNTFEALEVMNGTAPSIATLNDWMTFTSRGWLKVGTGVSDTHQAFKSVGGYARTWLKLGVDAPSAFTTALFRQAMLTRKASFSNGPFVVLTARALDGQGQPVGREFEVGETIAVAAGASMQLIVDVQAPEWMQFDAIELHTHLDGREAFNGVGNDTLKPAQSALRKTYDPTMLPLEAVPGLNGFVARRVHVRETFTVTPSADTWFLAMVRGSTAARTLSPMEWDWVDCQAGLCTASTSRAWGITNALLVDADGSGAYDDFPLKPTQPLRATTLSQPRGPRRVPTWTEVEAWARSLERH